MHNVQVHQTPHRGMVLATTILASSLAFIDGSVVNVALPAIAHGLTAGASSLQWVVNSYLLPLSALLLLGGAAGDHFGRRRLLMLGTGVFAVASLGCALAPGVSTLLMSRLLQGVGAAMLMPNSLAILGQTYSGDAKGRAVGIWAAVGAAMAAIGPVIGGWLVDLGSWRAIFLINLPIAAAAILLAWRSVPRDADTLDHPLDMWGGLLVTVGLGGLTWALTKGAGPGGWSPDAAGAAVASVALLFWFVRVEKNCGERAMMPLALFASKTFVGLSLLTFFLYGALSGLFVLVPFVLISAAGYSGTAAGAALLPFPLILSMASPAMGGLAGRIGARIPLVIGPLVVAGGFMLALRVDAAAPYWIEVLPMLLTVAFGMSAAVAPLTAAVLTSVDARHTGFASGFNNAIARTGGLAATALLGSVLAAQGHEQLTAFHAAMMFCAAASVAASLSAALLLSRQPDFPDQSLDS